MGTTPAEGLSRLRAAAADGRLDELCAAHEVRVLTIFGSAARDEAEAHDLDVAVGFEHGARPDPLLLIDAVSRLTGSDDIDLLVLDRAGPVVRERALVGCVPLYESQRGAYARARDLAMMERMDTDWLRRLDLELLAR